MKGEGFKQNVTTNITLNDRKQNAPETQKSDNVGFRPLANPVFCSNFYI